MFRKSRPNALRTALDSHSGRCMLAAVAAAIASGALPSTAYAETGEASSSEALPDEIVILGSRSATRTAAESTSPIDTISSTDLIATGGSTGQLRDALASLIPSFKVNVGSNLGTSAFTRSAGLRGLSGSHVLVLVNGKRRHAAASAYNAGGGSGANAVDLDQIPLGAIERVEVLRDGAAAQYGSDAVAGVINIVLKKSSEGGEASVFAGQRYSYRGKSDGFQGRLRLDHGFKLPNDGFIHAAVEVFSQDYAFRVGPSTERIYPLVGGQPDPREAARDKYIYRGGLARVRALYSSYNAELPIGDVTFYSYSTASVRDIKVGQSYRLPNSTSVLPELYTDVVQPTGLFPDYDFQFLGGVKGNWSAWAWDVSSTFGRNHVDNGEDDTLNPSLGPTSPTHFDTYDSISDQWATNLDIRRSFNVGLAAPLSLALGAEYRRERYQTIVKDAATYTSGGYIFPAGSVFAGSAAAVGAQGATIILPEDAARITRSNFAVYIDASTQLLPKWDVGASARFEHYDDSAGDVLVGKVSTRIEISPAIAVRATINNSFRAPSLTQQGFASSTRGAIVVNGVITGLTTVRIVKPESAMGAALGATPLKPEKSTNLSGGLSLTPAKNATLTIDGYAIWLKDRISPTSQLRGTGVNAILAANGLETGQVVTYYTNAIDTRTAGIDVVGEYSHRVGDWGKITWSLAFNYNRTKITDLTDTPAQLASLNLTLFDRVAQGVIELGDPRTKLILGSKIEAGPIRANLRLQRYGSVQLFTTNAVNDQHYGARWITDAEISATVGPRIELAIGANNLFNVYPERSTLVDATGGFPFASNSPFAYFGGFFYGRVSVKL